MRRAYIFGIFLCLLVMALGAARTSADDGPITSRALNYGASTPSHSLGKGIAKVTKTQPQLPTKNATPPPAKGSPSAPPGKLPHLRLTGSRPRTPQPPA